MEEIDYNHFFFFLIGKKKFTKIIKRACVYIKIPTNIVFKGEGVRRGVSLEELRRKAFVITLYN